jgi:hypothetical protein
VPLTIFGHDQDPEGAHDVFNRGRMMFGYTGFAVINSFWTATNDQVHDTALMTASASSCLIIVVHCADGSGALGHCFANPFADQMIDSTTQMVEALGCRNVESVVYAGGATSYGQDEYEQQILSATQQRHPGAAVSWPRRNDGIGWSACVYLPRSGELALFDTLPVDASLSARPDSSVIRQFGYHAAPETS